MFSSLSAFFIWPFLRLMFPSDVLLIFLSHTYFVLVCCFLLLVFQSLFLAFLFLLFRYMLGLLGEYNVGIMLEVIESCRQAGFQLADSVGAVFVLLFYLFPKMLQGICHFINDYM